MPRTRSLGRRREIGTSLPLAAFWSNTQFSIYLTSLKSHLVGPYEWSSLCNTRPGKRYLADLDFNDENGALPHGSFASNKVNDVELHHSFVNMKRHSDASPYLSP